MEIKFSEDAKKYLSDKIMLHSYVFLALDDGSSKFSKLGGSCSIGNKFQLVFAKNPDSDYNVKIDNNDNLNLFCSSAESTYLGTGLFLDYKMGLLKLSDNSGILDGAVTTKQVESSNEPDPITKQDLLNDENKTC